MEPVEQRRKHLRHIATASHIMGAPIAPPARERTRPRQDARLGVPVEGIEPAEAESLPPAFAGPGPPDWRLFSYGAFARLQRLGGLLRGRVVKPASAIGAA